MSDSKRVRLWRSSKSDADLQYDFYMRNPSAFNFSDIDNYYESSQHRDGEQEELVSAGDLSADSVSICSSGSFTDAASVSSVSRDVNELFNDSFHSDLEAGDGVEEFDNVAQENDAEVETGVEFSSLADELADWVTRYRIVRAAVGELLRILKRWHPELPLDCRTLLQTPRSVAVRRVAGGDYHYFGLFPKLVSYIEKHQGQHELNIHLNIDGVQNFRSKNTQLWPVLISVNKSQPMVVCLWYGGYDNRKPTDVIEFMKEFVEEYQQLSGGFEHKGIEYSVKLRACICDSPARSLLKQTVLHNGYHSCDRCCVRGERVANRSVYLEKNNTVRFDEMFEAEDYRGTHQVGSSPMAPIIGCVTGFVLDYMHLVCLGVVKRMVQFWRREYSSAARLSPRVISGISASLQRVRGSLPSEFARQPRSLQESDNWKATEWRQFLLYTGPVVLKEFLSEDHYDHFVALSLAMSILLDNNDFFRNHYLSYADGLLNWFVDEARTLYGDSFISYNVHSITHLADDCVNHQCSLNDISAFPYENFLGSLNRLVRNNNNVVAQIVKRLSENQQVGQEKSNVLRIKPQTRDNTVLLSGDKFAIVEGIDGSEFLVKKIPSHMLTPLYENPTLSTEYQICVVRKSRLADIQCERVPSGSVIRKVVCIPTDTSGTKLALLPLRHDIGP